MRRKKKKKRSFFQKFFSLVIIILSILLIADIIILNVLDFIHLWFVMAIILVLGMIVLFILKRGRKLGYLISIIYSAILIFIVFNASKTVAFLNDLDLNYKTYNYSVIVLKKSDYKKLGDIRGKKLGFYDDGSVENDKAMDKVNKKVSIEKLGYEDTHQMAVDLIDGKVDAILIENSYLDIYNESINKDGVPFSEMVRKIYGFVVFTKTYDISKDINVTKEPFNIYVSGIDTYGEISSVSRSDVNMVVTVNPTTKQILFTSIPRDYYVKLHGRSGYRDKLTHAGLYGVDMSIQTIEDLLDIDINYYVKVNFSSVVKIVDALGGVDVYSDKEFTSIDNFHYNKGYNSVNGEQALSFARERKSFAGGDRQRILNQQALLSAIFNKVTNKSIITKYSKLLDSISGSFVTNMKMSRLTSLIRLQVEKNYSWGLISNSLAGEDSSNYTYSASSVKSYVMLPIDDSVSYAHKLITDMMEGEVLDADEVIDGSKKASQGVSSVRGEIVEKKESTPKEDNNNQENTPKKEVNDNLDIKLGRNEVQMVEGDTFVYYGYSLSYQGKDITNNSDLIERFSVQGKTFTDYKELVLYVSMLESGEYSIIYTIDYNGKTVTANQKVIISEKEEEEEENVDDEKEKEIKQDEVESSIDQD